MQNFAQLWSPILFTVMFFFDGSLTKDLSYASTT